MSIETFHVGALTVRIDHDDNPGNPREDFDEASKLALSHKRYDLADEVGVPWDSFTSHQEVIDFLNERFPGGVIVPVWGYDHSGLALSAGDRIGQFADQWDSGQLGYAVIDAATLESEWTGTDEERRQKAVECIQAELQSYQAYLNGYVYTYAVENARGDVVDSCGGFYDIDDAMQEAKASAESYVDSDEAKVITDAEAMKRILALGMIDADLVRIVELTGRKYGEVN